MWRSDNEGERLMFLLFLLLLLSCFLVFSIQISHLFWISTTTWQRLLLLHKLPNIHTRLFTYFFYPKLMNLTSILHGPTSIIRSIPKHTHLPLSFNIVYQTSVQIPTEPESDIHTHTHLPFIWQVSAFIFLIGLRKGELSWPPKTLQLYLIR